MTTETMTLFFALLTVAAQVAVAGTVVVAVAGRWSPAAARLRASVTATVGPQALGLAFLVALVATLGSLYLSEVAHFTPCTLCWYQRICMYPLAVVLGLAAWRRDLAVRPYALALTVLGTPISAYHYLLERFPSLESAACDPANPCTVVWVWRFHYLSIPLMAGSAFALVATLLLLARPVDPPPRARHDAHRRPGEPRHRSGPGPRDPEPLVHHATHQEATTWAGSPPPSTTASNPPRGPAAPPAGRDAAAPAARR